MVTTQDGAIIGERRCHFSFFRTESYALIFCDWSSFQTMNHTSRVPGYTTLWSQANHHSVVKRITGKSYPPSCFTFLLLQFGSPSLTHTFRLSVNDHHYLVVVVCRAIAPCTIFFSFLVLSLYEQFEFFFGSSPNRKWLKNWFKVTCASNWWVRYIGVHFYVLCEEPGPNLNPSTPSTSHSLDSGTILLPDSLCLLLSLASYRLSRGLVARSEDSQLVLRSVVLKRLFRHPKSL